MEYYQLAANQGNAHAIENLGQCYELGHGVDQNWSKALELYKLSLDQGNTNAQSRTDRLNLKLKRLFKSIRL